jgi:ferric-dicitrate binding protein FerR (iron transport regulator)
MLHKDYDRKGSVEKNVSDRESQGAWRQDELISDKTPVVK